MPENNNGFIKLIVYKLDGNGLETTSTVSNVGFDLYTETNIKVGNYYTNSGGEIVVGNLPYGNYYFQANNLPSFIDSFKKDVKESGVNYKATKTYGTEKIKKIKFSVSSSNNTVDKAFLIKLYCSLKKGMFSISLKGDDGVGLSGVGFSVTVTDSLSLKKSNVGTFFTNENGLINLKNMSFGSYQIEQINTFSGYKKDDQVYFLRIDENNFSNENVIEIVNVKESIAVEEEKEENSSDEEEEKIDNDNFVEKTNDNKKKPLNIANLHDFLLANKIVFEYNDENSSNYNEYLKNSDIKQLKIEPGEGLPEVADKLKICDELGLKVTARLDGIRLDSWDQDTINKALDFYDSKRYEYKTENELAGILRYNDISFVDEDNELDSSGAEQLKILPGESIDSVAQKLEVCRNLNLNVNANFNGVILNSLKFFSINQTINFYNSLVHSRRVKAGIDVESTSNIKSSVNSSNSTSINSNFKSNLNSSVNVNQTINNKTNDSVKIHDEIQSDLSYNNSNLDNSSDVKNGPDFDNGNSSFTNNNESNSAPLDRTSHKPGINNVGNVDFPNNRDMGVRRNNQINSNKLKGDNFSDRIRNSLNNKMPLLPIQLNQRNDDGNKDSNTNNEGDEQDTLKTAQNGNLGYNDQNNKNKRRSNIFGLDNLFGSSKTKTKEDSSSLFSATFEIPKKVKLGIAIGIASFMVVVVFMLIIPTITVWNKISGIGIVDEATLEDGMNRVLNNGTDNDNYNTDVNVGMNDSDIIYLASTDSTGIITLESHYSSDDTSNYIQVRSSRKESSYEVTVEDMHDIFNVNIDCDTTDCTQTNEYKFFLKFYDIYKRYSLKGVTLDVALIYSTLAYGTVDYQDLFAQNLNNYDRTNLTNSSILTNLDWDYDYKNINGYNYLDADDSRFDLQILAKNMVTKNITVTCGSTTSTYYDIENSKYSDYGIDTCSDGSSATITANYILDKDKYKKFLLEYIAKKKFETGSGFSNTETGGTGTNDGNYVTNTGSTSNSGNTYAPTASGADYTENISLGSTLVNIALSQQNNGGSIYQSFMGLGSSDAWCAAFVSWAIANTTYDGINLSSIITYRTAQVTTYADYFHTHADGTNNNISFYYNENCSTYAGKNNGVSYSPKAGDLIFFSNAENWDGSWPAYREYFGHIGIVVSSDSDYVYTIEGNTANIVHERNYPLSSCRVVGYGSWY